MASTVGILSQGIKLGYANAGGTATYTFLDNLQEIPDLGQAPESIDTTCLADTGKHSINGLIDYGTLEFTFLYDKSVYETLYGMSNTNKAWCIELKDNGDGEGSKFEWEGQPSVSLAGAAVNGALQFKLSISVSSDMTFTPAA